jgi:hypothetical protein
MSEERAKLVEAIMKRPTQPTLVDAVEVLKFDKIQTVYALLELDGKLRRAWWDRKDSIFWWM